MNVCKHNGKWMWDNEKVGWLVGRCETENSRRKMKWNWIRLFKWTNRHNRIIVGIWVYMNKKTSYVKINKKCTIDARPMHKKLQHLFSRWNKFKRITLCFGTIQKKRASVSMYSFHHEFVDALKNWRWSLITFTQNAEREKKVVNSPIRKL